MRCPYCAEEIQDAAILCRFCGARRLNDAWQAPAGPMPANRAASPARTTAGAFTIKLSAIFLLASALFELASITSPVPLFGAMRGGIVAVLHHGLYVVGFAIAGYGLFKALRIGYHAVFGLTAWYTLDKLVYLLDTHAREAELTAATSSDLVRQITGVTGQGDILVSMKAQIFQMYTITTLVVLACWWGFALYIYLRRAYFGVR